MDEERESETPHKRKCWSCRILGVLALFALLFSVGVALLYWKRETVLPSLARWWVVNERPEKADAILVMGGGVGWRPIEAAKLYASGFAPKILTINVHPNAAVDLGLEAPEGELVGAVLESKGVPKSAIVSVGHASSSTYEDIWAARNWAQSNHAVRILIPTDIAHSRRAAWTAKRLLDSSGIQSRVLAFAPPEYNQTNWWQTEEGLIAFQNELIKFALYLRKY